MGKKVKKAEKEKQAAQRRNKRGNRREGNSCHLTENDAEMKFQLEKIGLGLKEVQGDGNCLFRALADQLYGQADKYHADLRKHTVDFMRKNRSDFEPFFVVGQDGQSFDRHLELLSEDGTYAGNDAIVSFARRYEVTVVIHQLNEPLWKVNETEPKQRQLHISYHNGDHYNSVRKLGDLTGWGKPANVHLEANNVPVAEEPIEEVLSDYENVPDPSELRMIIEEVKDRTGLKDVNRIREALINHDYLVEQTVTALVKEIAIQTAQKAKSTLWREGGTGERIFGSQVADVAVTSTKPLRPTTNREKKKEKRRNKRNNRIKNNCDSDEDVSETMLVTDLASLSI